MDLAWEKYKQQNWEAVIYLTGLALGIQKRSKNYITENTAWGSLPWDLQALAFFYTGQYEKAHEAISEALKYAPENKRLQENRVIIEHALGKTSLAAK